MSMVKHMHGTAVGFAPVHYVNPMVNCPSAFHQRILEITALEDETKFSERRLERKRQQQRLAQQSSSNTEQCWKQKADQTRVINITRIIQAWHCPTRPWLLLPQKLGKLRQFPFTLSNTDSIDTFVSMVSSHCIFNAVFNINELETLQFTS